MLLQHPYAAGRNPEKLIIVDDCFQHSRFHVVNVALVIIKSIEKLSRRQILKHENVEGYLKSKVPGLIEFHNKISNGELKHNHVEWIKLLVELGNYWWPFDR